MNFETLFKEEIKKLGVLMVESPWHNKDFYAAWLAQTYYFAKDTTRLLMLCGARVSREHQKLHFRFIEHAAEEKGHESLLLRDLKNLGFQIDDIEEFPSAAGFYQSQYYWIDHRSPFAFFGYILALEGLAADYGKPAYQKANDAFGGGTTSFLKVHAEEDVDHTEKALKEVLALPPEAVKMIEANFKLAVRFYASILKDCKEFAAERGKTNRKAS